MPLHHRRFIDNIGREQQQQRNHSGGDTRSSPQLRNVVVVSSVSDAKPTAAALITTGTIRMRVSGNVIANGVFEMRAG